MNAKEFLNQAFSLNCRINSKLDQIESLHDLSARVSSPSINDMPGSPNRNIHQMENFIVKLMDMRGELSRQAAQLLDLKDEIMNVISQVEKVEHRTLLELRYLCFKSWDEIADDMNYGTRYIHIMHGKALAEVDDILMEKQKCAQ